MARIEWVKYRLENWALWKERESRGSLGYYTQSAFLKEFAEDRYRESIIPIDDVDASITNEAVESLRATRAHLYQTLHAIYCRGIGIREAARRAGVVESTIKARIDEADRALSQWFGERAERQRRAVMST